jgi:pilus assembly protein CpaC
MLHVKVMEVSRTKLRQLGFDFAKFNGGNIFVSQVSGLITAVTGGSITTANATAQFNIGNSTSGFLGVMNALRQDGLAKVLAEPNLVAISGRPAHFNVGGQYYYQLNGGITGPSTSFVNYGTIVDVVPIILGNGRIRLEVRAEVSEIDTSLTVVGGPPSLKTRVVETGVEMKAGQTLAIAGLVQNTVESQNAGLPWISEVPYLGVPFRNVHEQINEVETLITVTPELVEALDANQVPPCGPGLESASPSDWELFFMGHLEVPVCCRGGGSAGGNPDVAPPGGLPPAAPCGPGGAAASDPDNPYTANNPSNSTAAEPSQGRNPEPPFLGPIGYDLVP